MLFSWTAAPPSVALRIVTQARTLCAYILQGGGHKRAQEKLLQTKTSRRKVVLVDLYVSLSYVHIVVSLWALLLTTESSAERPV